MHQHERAPPHGREDVKETSVVVRITNTFYSGTCADCPSLCSKDFSRQNAMLSLEQAVSQVAV